MRENVVEIATPEQKKGFLQRLSAIVDRTAIGQALGVLFKGKRDLYDAFGWNLNISLQMINEMYCRGGVSHRIVHAYPDATWGRPPQLYVKGDDAWNKKWDDLVKTSKLWDAIYRADVLAGLGRYSILLIGTNQGALNIPLRSDGRTRPVEITYLQPYGEESVRVSKWDNNPLSPRFGLPDEYEVNYNATNTRRQLSSTTMIVPVRASFKVHHSRVLHVSRGGLESKLVGLPRYAPIWNYLTDLMKVVGASAESYWMTAYQGLVANVDKELDLDPEDEAALSAEIDDYQNNLRRFIRTRGTDVKSLGSHVANPMGAFDVILTLIAGTTGIPKRILLGSEAGQLASAQDKGNWAERVEEHRTLHCEPNIIIPFMEWCKTYGLLEVDFTKIMVLWPEAYRMSPLERAQQGAQIARSMANIVKGLQPIEVSTGNMVPSSERVAGLVGSSVPPPDPSAGNPNVNATPAPPVPPKGKAAPPPFPPKDGAPAADPNAPPPDPQVPEVQMMKPLLTWEEARKILGLSSDDRLLTERPD